MATSEPLVSICLPVYNGGGLIFRALESATRQTYRTIEIVVVDNASTDNTGEVVKRYAARDSRVRYVRNEFNIGPTRNFLKALELARGTYAQFLGHDDWLSRDYLEIGVRNFIQHPNTAAVLARTISFSLEADGALRLIGDARFRDGEYSREYLAKHLYRTVMGSIIMYALLRREDLIRATDFALTLFERPPEPTPQKFKELQKKFFGIDIVIVSKIFLGYPHVTFTNASAFMKLSNPGSASVLGEREGLGKGSVRSILTDYGFFRRCHEYVYATDLPKCLFRMRAFIGKEALITVLFEFLRRSFPAGFFRDFRSAVNDFFETYSWREKVAVALSIPPSMLVRAARFGVRALKRRKTIDEYREYLIT